MSTYLNGKIYKLHSYDNELIYIGSTIQALSQRYAGHKTNFKKNRRVTSKILFENSDNVIITLIKLFPCNCKSELEAEERLYIQNIECVNKAIPTRTAKEYRQDNKEKITEKNRIHRQNNKEQFKVYCQNNKEKLSKQHQIYRQNNKEKTKEYMNIYIQNNKKMISEKQRIYRQNNKKMILEKHQIYYKNNKQNINHYQYWYRNPQLFDKIKPLFYDM